MMSGGATLSGAGRARSRFIQQACLSASVAASLFAKGVKTFYSLIFPLFPPPPNVLNVFLDSENENGHKPITFIEAKLISAGCFSPVNNLPSPIYNTMRRAN